MASVHAFGPSPEHEAGRKLTAWAKARGLLGDPQKHRIFGFNNPNPSPGSPNYGYEFWIVVDPDTTLENQEQDEINLKDFPGGRYAVTRCEVKGDPEIIGQIWKKLVAWCEDSPHQFAHHQWLEEHIGYMTLSDNITLDLYLPIAPDRK